MAVAVQTKSTAFGWLCHWVELWALGPLTAYAKIHQANNTCLTSSDVWGHLGSYKPTFPDSAPRTEGCLDGEGRTGKAGERDQATPSPPDPRPCSQSEPWWAGN